VLFSSVRAASASSRAFRTATVRRQPLWPRCAATESKRHGFLTARSIARGSSPMSSNVSSRRCGQVSLDNLGSPKSKAVRDARRAVGAKRIFLPAYSPGLNPIEQVFAKLKHRMRKAGERPIDATCTAWEPRSTTSRRKNAQTISGMQDMRHDKVITSLGRAFGSPKERSMPAERVRPSA
jgi:hypothetical protein